MEPEISSFLRIKIAIDGIMPTSMSVTISSGSSPPLAGRLHSKRDGGALQGCASRGYRLRRLSGTTLLQRVTGSPIVALNRAVQLPWRMDGSELCGDLLASQGDLDEYHLYTRLADLLRRMGLR